jgi:hypothetical protein
MENLNPELMEELDSRTDEEISYFLKEKEEIEKIEKEVEKEQVLC